MATLNGQLEGDDPGTQRARELVRQRILVAGDKAPSSRQQSASFVNWGELAASLGQPFDVTKIPLSKLYQMRRDPMIGFALHYIRAPLVKADWYIECEDAQIAAFIDNALREIYGRYIHQDTMSLDFGWQSIVKRFKLSQPDWTYIDPNNPTRNVPVWPSENVEAITWKPFVTLRPEHVNPSWNIKGEFDGMEYFTTTQRGFPFERLNDSTSKVPLTHSLWVTNEKDSEFGSVWGYPRTGYSYRYWWTYWYNWALADRHFEKDADPPTLVYYPDASSLDEDDDVADNRDIALRIGQDARSGSTIALPSTTVSGGLDDKPTSLREWDIKFLEGGKNFEAFNTRFEYIDVLKLRSMWIPEQAFLEGKGGTSSRNVAAELTDAFDKSEAVTMQEIADRLNQFVIPQLVQINFPERRVKVTFKTKGFDPEDLDLIHRVVEATITNNTADNPIDLRESLRRAGAPLLSLEEMEQRKQDALDAALAATPPPTPSGAGGPAAVTETGFYIQMPELIKLSSKDRPKQFVPTIQVQEMEEVPSDVPGAVATYDEETGTVYFKKGLPLDEKISFLDALGLQLSQE